MGLIKKRIRQIDNAEVDTQVNLAKATSDKASVLIKQLSGKDELDLKKVPDNIIVFTNASGGTGVSTIVSNVAYTMMAKGFKVLVIDLNITCPVQHTNFGIAQEIEKIDLVTYLLGKTQMNESIDTKHPVNMLYANNRNLTDEINCNESIAISNFEILLSKCKQYYDVVLIDCPMRIDSMLQNVAFYNCDAIYTVWDEGISSIINTEKIRRNMALSGIDSFTKMRLILNKRTSLRFSDYPIKKLNMELVEVLPFDIDIIDNSLKGQIFCEKGASNSKNAIEWAARIEELTDKILAIGGYVGKK